MGTSPLPAPEGGKALVDPVGVRDSAHVGRLTPSGPRLGSSRVCGLGHSGAPPCAVLLLLLFVVLLVFGGSVPGALFVVLLVFGGSVLGVFGEAAPLALFRGGALGPQG